MIVKQSSVNDKLIADLLKCVFIYPTDTVYGIGCNAENLKLVKKIREIKGRDQKPFSIIAPNFSYILKNCEVPQEEKFLKKFLPGPYTLILKKKSKNFLSQVSEGKKIGVRIPNHPFTKALQKTEKPIVTTSANLSGNNPAKNLNELDKTIVGRVDFVIDGGEISGIPSTIINDGKIIKREK